MNPNALDKLEGPPVPLLMDGLLQPTQVRQLFADLTTHAKITGVRQKGGPTRIAPDSSLPLGEACERLLAGKLHALQVLYHYDGADWTDTLMRTPQGIRVVRCKHEPQPG